MLLVEVVARRVLPLLPAAVEARLVAEATFRPRERGWATAEAFGQYPTWSRTPKGSSVRCETGNPLLVLEVLTLFHSRLVLNLQSHTVSTCLSGG